MNAGASILGAVVYSLVAGEKSLAAGGHILSAGQKTLGAVAYILFAGEKSLSAVAYILRAGRKSLRTVAYILREVAYILFWCQGTLKEKGSILSPFLRFYFLIFLNSILLISLYCGLVAPKTDLTYFFTSNAVSTKPVLS
jgi:hypothetical protein